METVGRAFWTTACWGSRELTLRAGAEAAVVVMDWDVVTGSLCELKSEG